jgi:pyruvate formate lyase activating enzyme
MKNLEVCPVCIRECPIGRSYCNRRDKEGLLKHKNRFSALLIDSLYDKPLIHFTSNIRVLSIGSWGCNLRCLGCQNVHLSWTTTGESVGYVEMKPEEIVKLALENNCEGICYTYNEPAILLEVVEEIALKAREVNLFNIFITNSTLTQISANRIALSMDAVAADIKCMEDDFYYQYCGATGISNIASKILDCIKAFRTTGCHVEVRTNLITGANDKDKNLHEIAHWIKLNLGQDTPWHITRFFPAHKLSHLPPTFTKDILKAQTIGLDEGLKYVHTHFNKGCDCAKDVCMIEANKKTCKISVKSCCD